MTKELIEILNERDPNWPKRTHERVEFKRTVGVEERIIREKKIMFQRAVNAAVLYDTYFIAVESLRHLFYRGGMETRKTQDEQ